MLKCLKLIFIVMISGSISLFGQEVKGVVKDANSRKPIANAQIITSKSTILTNDNGEFVLKDLKLGSLLAVRIMGYVTTEIKT